MIKKILTILLITFLIQGCVIKSTAPWGLPKDKVFENKLIGNWSDKEQKTTMNITRIKNDNYHIIYAEKNDSGIFNGILYKIDKDYYLDYTPATKSINPMTDISHAFFFPLHGVLKVQFTDTGVDMISPEFGPFKKYVESKKGGKKLQVVDNDEDLIITDTSKNIRRYMLKHKDELFYNNTIRLLRDK